MWFGRGVETKKQVIFVVNLIQALRDDVMMNNDYEMIVKKIWDWVKKEKEEEIFLKKLGQR